MEETPEQEILRLMEESKDKPIEYPYGEGIFC
jgi:hypothetical protein